VLVLALALGLAAGLDTLQLRPHERILIVAPHPDDEVVACGGLIQNALALGDSAWVVYVTAGDGSWPPAWRVTGNMLAGPADYLELGRARRREAIAGAKTLGLDSAQLTFLGYPDADLARLWQQCWRSPCRSSHTDATADPYSKAGREYTGASLLGDLMSVLKACRPDIVFAPHALDAHADHWSTAMLMAIAREVWQQPEAEQFPLVYCYLVHRPPYPEAQTDASGLLSPPPDLSGAAHHWFALSLNQEQVRTKRQALNCHDSQQGTFGSDLHGYVGQNELFDRVEPGGGEVAEDAPPTGFVPAARLRRVQAAVRGDSLDLDVSLRAEPASSFRYTFFAHSVGFEADTARHSDLALELGPIRADDSGWTVRLPWAGHSEHGVMLYSVEVRWGKTLINHSGIGRVIY